MLFELLMRSIIKSLHGGLFQNPIYGFNLSIAPRVFEFSLSVLYLMLIENTLKYMKKRIFMMIMIGNMMTMMGKLNAIVGQNFMYFLRNSLNQLT
jgi:hypothetical protein